jgi:hypothetical protein
MSKRMFRRIPQPPLIIAGVAINQDRFELVRQWRTEETREVGDNLDTDLKIYERLTLSLQINRHVPEFWDDFPVLDLNEYLATEAGPRLNVSDELRRLRHRPMPWAIHDGG